MRASGPAAASRTAALTLPRDDGLRHPAGQVHDRAVGHGHADRHAVEPALQARQDLADGLRGARRRRDDVLGGGAAAAQVLVRHVGQALVVGVRVHRRHEALLDAEALVEDLRDRGEAVGRARGVRDDAVLGAQVAVVDAHRRSSRRSRPWRGPSGRPCARPPRGASRGPRASGSCRSPRPRRRRRACPTGSSPGPSRRSSTTRRPATVMLSASVETSFGKTRMTVSYFRR